MVLLRETDEAVIDDIKKEVELIKECIAAPWIYVHIAAVFESNISDPRTLSDICGIDHVTFSFAVLQLLIYDICIALTEKMSLNLT